MNMKLRPGNPEEVGMSPQRVRHIVDLAEGWVAEGVTKALVILAARRGVIVMHEAFGRLTPEEDSPPLELDSIYPVASLTKPITVTLAMNLVEDGLLGLNRPVSWYIPEFVGEGKDAVMVHHLLTHTSGLRDGDVNEHAEKKKGTVEIPPSDETQHPWMNEYLFLRCDGPLREQPGMQMAYCNYGLNLAGEIVRRVSGKSLEEFGRERIFDPLGMKDTFYVVPDSVKHRIVKRPEDAPNAGLNDPLYQEIPCGAGCVFSTAMDMAAFCQMFLNHGAYGDARILSPASVAEMTRNQISGISARWGNEFFHEASWGFGWSIHGNKRSLGRGTLHSPDAFARTAAGGACLWTDPIHEIVGVYFCVQLGESYTMNFDLFMNAVTAAIVD